MRSPGFRTRCQTRTRSDCETRRVPTCPLPAFAANSSRRSCGQLAGAFGHFVIVYLLMVTFSPSMEWILLSGIYDSLRPVWALTCWARKLARTVLAATERSSRDTIQVVTNASGTEKIAGLS